MPRGLSRGECLSHHPCEPSCLIMPSSHFLSSMCSSLSLQIQSCMSPGARLHNNVEGVGCLTDANKLALTKDLRRLSQLHCLVRGMTHSLLVFLLVDTITGMYGPPPLLGSKEFASNKNSHGEEYGLGLLMASRSQPAAGVMEGAMHLLGEKRTPRKAFCHAQPRY